MIALLPPFILNIPSSSPLDSTPLGGSPGLPSCSCRPRPNCGSSSTPSSLSKVSKFLKNEKEQPPILGLATPPGSGKTCGAVLLHKILNDLGHVLVYSVPTKQVLIRVGQECEVAGVVCWVVTRASAGQFEVRRPYSVRTLRTKGTGGTSSAMAQRAEGKQEHHS